MSFTGFNMKLYGHGIQSFLLLVLGIALGVTSVLIASYSVAPSLYGVLPADLTIVHFDGTSILLSTIYRGPMSQWDHYPKIYAFQCLGLKSLT